MLRNIVKSDLVKEEQLAGKIGCVMTVARTLLKSPFANVKVSTLYFNGTVKTLGLKDPLNEPIVGNISEARAPNDPNETRSLKAAAVTGTAKSLKMRRL